MRLLFIIFSIVLGFLLFPKSNAEAALDPLSVTNNKFGIHILFDSELEEAARLVNSGGGDWGYVVIPLEAADKDIEKWQNFMDKASKSHIIPIIRIATENYYFNTKVWRKPTEADILDFANFLNSLSWPTKNRYVILFNEVNRDDEWGGKADPAQYAELLSYGTTVLKSLSSDFFILNAGLDNASVNGYGAINKLTYLQRMNQAVPGIFNQIDGFVSHAYPNPSFSQPPSVQNVTSIASFRYERSLVKQMTNKDLPIFITETGWSGQTIPDDVRGQYYKDAFETVWSDPDIVMVAPFLLRAGGGPFQKFSFLNQDGKPSKQYGSVAAILKQKGQPTLNDTPNPTPQVLGTEVAKTNLLPIHWFSTSQVQKKKITTSQVATGIFNWLFGL